MSRDNHLDKVDTVKSLIDEEIALNPDFANRNPEIVPPKGLDLCSPAQFPFLQSNTKETTGLDNPSFLDR